MSETDHDSGAHDHLPDPHVLGTEAAPFPIGAAFHSIADEAIAAIDLAFDSRYAPPHDPHADAVATAEILWWHLTGLPSEGFAAQKAQAGAMMRILRPAKGAARRFTPTADDIRLSHDIGSEPPAARDE
jgi:hypothetical protein